MDNFCHSLDFVAAGIGQWLHDWRICSRPAGHRHRRGAGPSYSGTKTLVAFLTLAGEGGQQVQKDFIESTNPSVEKVS